MKKYLDQNKLYQYYLINQQMPNSLINLHNPSLNLSHLPLNQPLNINDSYLNMLSSVMNQMKNIPNFNSNLNNLTHINSITNNMNSLNNLKNYSYNTGYGPQVNNPIQSLIPSQIYPVNMFGQPITQALQQSYFQNYDKKDINSNNNSMKTNL